MSKMCGQKGMLCYVLGVHWVYRDKWEMVPALKELT